MNESLPDDSQKIHFNSSLCTLTIASPLKSKRFKDVEGLSMYLYDKDQILIFNPI